jgi:hypothetical protein
MKQLSALVSIQTQSSDYSRFGVSLGCVLCSFFGITNSDKNRDRETGSKTLAWKQDLGGSRLLNRGRASSRAFLGGAWRTRCETKNG